MATIEEHEASMTIFYFKSNGDIHSYATGIQDLSMFMSHEQDYSLILGCIVVEKDPAVIESLNKFYIDIETNRLRLKAEYNLNKYL